MGYTYERGFGSKKNYPEGNIQHTVHGESLISRITLFTSGTYSCVCWPEVSGLSCPGEGLCHL